jgi:hypothetical protein
MAYATFTQYKKDYLGNVITESDFPRWIIKASREIDNLTFKRLVDYFPTDEYTVSQVVLCTCEIAELLQSIDGFNSSFQQSGVIKSISAGSESITYADNKYVSMASDTGQLNKNLFQIAKKYLSNLCDSEDNLLLYRGIV